MGEEIRLTEPTSSTAWRDSLWTHLLKASSSSVRSEERQRSRLHSISLSTTLVPTLSLSLHSLLVSLLPLVAVWATPAPSSLEEKEVLQRKSRPWRMLAYM